jgi:4,5-DOPA dioxygenase extradiol
MDAPSRSTMLRRRDVVRQAAAWATMGLAVGCEDSRSVRSGEDQPMTNNDAQAGSTTQQRMPVVFVGHGSPMNAMQDNRFSRGFTSLAKMVPRPSAILAVSAHWFVDGTYLTAQASPPTIHDFSGFPSALYEIEYPARGDVGLAKRVRAMLAADEARLRSDWGLDHGTWSVLRWMFPDADVPVVQLSIDRRLAPQRHLQLGRSLAELRDEGVLILGSGNIVHNLRDAFGRMRTGSTDTPGWAARFDHTVEQVVQQRDAKRLVSLWPDSEDGRLAHPSPDHWLPLLYAEGAAADGDEARFAIEGFDLGSISMRSIVFG